MPTLEFDDDLFLDDLELELDDTASEAFDQATVADDLFSEVPTDASATEDLHGDFDGDLRKGLMARIATAGAIKG